MSSDLPPVRDLGHGIGVVPLPLPFASPRSVNVYLIRGPESLVMIDCGVDSHEGRTALERGTAELGVDLDDVDLLVVSHLHPDHVGLAPVLTKTHSMQLVMHERAGTLYERYNDSQGLVARTEELARVHGIPEQHFGGFVDLGPRPSFMPLLDPPDRLVRDGDEISLGGDRRLQVLATPGHDPAHICLRDTLTGILFAGDHVLPRITPVIMFDESAEDVLGDYLTSLRYLIDLDIGLTYPAHGMIIERGSGRCEQILLHHERRLGGMIEFVHRGPNTAWMVMIDSYRPNLSPGDQRLALRETVSHLEHLVCVERLARFDEDGTAFYRT